MNTNVLANMNVWLVKELKLMTKYWKYKWISIYIMSNIILTNIAELFEMYSQIDVHSIEQKKYLWERFIKLTWVNKLICNTLQFLSLNYFI